MRRLLARLEEAGQLRVVEDEVDWKYEIGAWTRASYDSREKPALLFTNIRGYPGARMLTAVFTTPSRLALALGQPEATPLRDLARLFRQRVGEPLAPVLVQDGPVRERVLRGAEVDLEKMVPAPWWLPGDGGRYLGTWHANVTRNGETGRLNAGVYRMQLLGPRWAALKFSRYSHFGLHLGQRERAGEPLEMAVVIGADERVVMAAATGVPEPVDEYAVAGALMGRPLRLVRCETIDALVPAEAEMVIEGRFLPGERCLEGPFGEYTGYYSPGGNRCPVFRVSALTCRQRPIMRGCLSGRPVCEDHVLFHLIGAAGLLNFGGPRWARAIEGLTLGSGLYGHLHRLYPIVHFLRGRRGWPRPCEPPRELMRKVSTRWRGA